MIKALFCDIRDLRKQPVRAKMGMAAHVVGAYVFSTKQVINKLFPNDIGNAPSYVEKMKELFEQAMALVDEIKHLTAKIAESKIAEEKLQHILKETESATIADMNPTTVLTETLHPSLDEVMKIYANGSMEKWTPVKIRNEQDLVEMIRTLLRIEVTSDFFFLGDLKRNTVFSIMGNDTLEGSDDEKEKYDKLNELSYTLHRIEMRQKYLLTFEDILFVPIAIQNVSSIKDEDISVVVNVVHGEIVDLSDDLICNELDSLQGTICEEGIINELFGLPEDDVIRTEETPYNPADFAPPILNLSSYGFSEPKKTAEDYLADLEDYIMPSMGKGYYEFHISSLRPGECKWFAQGILIRQSSEGIELEYHIHSAHSSGELSGKLIVQSKQDQ